MVVTSNQETEDDNRGPAALSTPPLPFSALGSLLLRWIISMYVCMMYVLVLSNIATVQIGRRHIVMKMMML